MRTSIAFVALSSISSVALAAPLIKRQTTRPYFAVSDFSWERNEQSSSYELNLSFPEDVSVSNTPASDPVYVVPGSKDVVPCSGNYQFDSAQPGSTVTTENTCASTSDPRKTVTTKMDVTTGTLFLTYTLSIPSSKGTPQVFTYTATQDGLTPISSSSPETETVYATSGPGIDR